MAEELDDGELMRAAILLALSEAPLCERTLEDLELRVAELLLEGESGLRRRGAALRSTHRN